MKVTKSFRFGRVHLSFIADIFNLFDFKYLSFAGLGDPYLTSNATDNYMNSLHFKAGVYEELSEHHIAGDDKMGDYRPEDVAYQPMEWISRFSDFTNPDERIYYYVGNIGDLQNYFPDQNIPDELPDNERYVQYVDGQWVRVASGEVKSALDDKAYIRNPVNESFLFLGPRDIFMGLKISFDL